MTTLSSLYGKGLVSDVAYPTGWDGETNIAPSKNTVYDEMENRIPDSTFTADSEIIVGTGAGTYQAESGATARQSLLGVADGAASLKMFMNAGATAPEWAVGMKIGTFTRDTSIATGTQAVSGVGFKPSHVIFMAVQEGAVEFSIGFDDGTLKSAIANYATAWARSSVVSIFDYQSSGNYYRGLITTLGVDGFTITWTRTGTPTGTIDVYYLAFR